MKKHKGSRGRKVKGHGCRGKRAKRHGGSVVSGKNGEDVSAREQLDSALEKYSLSTSPYLVGRETPDYNQFRLWFYEKSKDESTRFVDDHNVRGSFFSALIRRLVELDKQLRESGGSHDISLFNKYKLLRSILNEGERGRAILGMLDGGGFEHNADLKPDLSSAPAIVMRREYFRAVENNDESRALKILGMLHTKSGENDPGELAYLEALYNYKASKYEEALSYAKSVTANQPDYKNARRVILDCLANLGDEKSFALEVGNQRDIQFSPAAWMYLYLLLATNIDAGCDLREDTYDLFRQVNEPINGNDPAYYRLLEIWGWLSVELFERWIDYEAQQDVQTISNGKDGAAYCDTATLDYLKYEQPRLYQLLIAITTIDPTITEALEHEEYSEYVLKTVWRIPDGGYPTFEQVYLCLLSQFRFEKYADMLGNFYEVKDIVLNSSDDRSTDLINIAYQASVLIGDTEETEKVIKFINEAGVDLDYSQLAYDIDAKQCRQWLSPMGKLAYDSAHWALEKALEKNFQWKDAGLISLGFFRILELELNSKLIRPLLKPEMLDAIDLYIESMEAEGGREDLSNNKKKRYDKSIGYWKGVRKKLHSIFCGRTSGMELGTLEWFLKKLKKAEGEDAEIKNHLVDMLDTLLTPVGSQALKSGEIAKPISEEMREKYRNPPAHTRFLPLSVARESVDHIHHSIRRYAEWIA